MTQQARTEPLPTTSQPPDSVTLPPGRTVQIGDRGSAFVRRIQGPPGAPTVVLLHGWGATADLNWFRSYAALGEHYSVIAMDHRGHGRGIRDNRRFKLADCADDTAALLRQLGIGSAIVAGYSMGGPVAQLLWRRHPELVGGLVLCATAMSFRSTARERLMFAAITPTTTIGKLAPPRLRNDAALRIMLSKDDRDMRLWAQAEIAGHDWMRVLEAGREIGTYDSSNWVGGIDVPTSQLMTIEDNIVPLSRQEALAHELPDATLHLVPGGHAVCIEDAPTFVPALQRAVGSVASRL